MHKFFVNHKNIIKNKINIEGEDVTHIAKVLRIRRGEEILVSDGKGNEYLSKISEISKSCVECEIVEAFTNTSEPPVKITLFQGLPKAQKMDLIVQKCVEIGIYQIQPVITERVVVKVEGKDMSGKLDRWRRISEEAAKQSNRGIIPEVLPPILFQDAVKALKTFDLAVMPYEKEKDAGLKRLLRENSSIKELGIFIGPEGGFDETETGECLSNGIIPVTLGPRILRTETAGFAAVSMALFEIGDMGGNI